VAAVGLVVTAGMWLRHGQAATFGAAGGPATAAGQLTALIGTYLVLVQLLLMSRISWLERAIGLDRLAVWHRWNGFAVVWLLTAHVVFTTIGWAQLQGLSIPDQLHSFVFQEADALMAIVGFALFIAVAVTSVRMARRALRRETWYFIHLYAYLAVALSFAHQLALGADFTRDRAARAWWVLLYALVGATIVWWRVLTPLLANRRHGLRVHAVQREAPGVVSIHISGRRLDELAAQPGQFFLWRFLTPSGWWQAHPFSLSAPPTPKRLRITVKSLGDYTGRLQSIKKGTRVFAEGPYGTFTEERRHQRRVLLVAGGIGITPLRALLDTFTPDDDVVMLYRVVRADDVIFADELRRFANEQHITIHVITGSEIGDDRTDLLGIPALRKGVPDIATRECFLCGPPALVDALRRRLPHLGVPHDRIHFERFEL